MKPWVRTSVADPSWSHRRWGYTLYLDPQWMVNAAMDEEHFFAIANLKLALNGKYGWHMKQLIALGESMNLLLEANQPPSSYAMALRPYSSALGAGFDNAITTAIINYHGKFHPNYHLIFLFFLHIMQHKLQQILLNSFKA